MRAIASPFGALAALALLLTAAFAPSSSAGPAFHDLKEAHGCSFLISDPRESGYHTLRAECDWPKVAAARVERVLVDLRGWDATFSHLSRSVVIKEDEGQPVVLRVGYTGKGFPDQSADLSVTQARTFCPQCAKPPHRYGAARIRTAITAPAARTTSTATDGTRAASSS